jgi:hypothetical protein
MFGKPGAPARLDLVAGLIEAARARRLAAVHQTGMAPVVAGQELHDASALPMGPCAQHDRIIGPLHGSVTVRPLRGARSERPFPRRP